jgi:hypothetical protein
MRKLLVLLVMGVGVCPADIVNLDFRETTPWGDATGLHSYTNVFTPGYSITLTALPTIWSTLQQSSDGIGIDSFSLFDEDDEINGLEFLKIDFAPTVGLDSSTVSKLFWRSGWVGDKDAGAYELNGSGAWHAFSGRNAVNGILTIDISSSEVRSIKFKALTIPLGSDFALRGMELAVPNSVSDGGVTLMLLGGALAGLEVLRRKLSA